MRPNENLCSSSNCNEKAYRDTAFTRSWTLSDETEVRSVTFEDGLLIIDLGKIVPEHHQTLKGLSINPRPISAVINKYSKMYHSDTI